METYCLSTGISVDEWKWNLVWRNQATGKNVVWYLDGANRTGSAELPPVANIDWQILA